MEEEITNDKISKHHKFFAYIVKTIASLICLYGFLMLIENILPYSNQVKIIESREGQEGGGFRIFSSHSPNYFVVIDRKKILISYDFTCNVMTGDTLIVGKSLFLNQVKRLTRKDNPNITYSTFGWWDILFGLMFLSNIITLITAAEDIDNTTLFWSGVNVVAIIVWLF